MSIAVGVVTVLAVLNLRGSRESGSAFAIPTYLYMAAIGITAVTGLVQELTGTLGRAASSGYEIAVDADWDQGLTNPLLQRLQGDLFLFELRGLPVAPHGHPLS